MSKGLIVKGVDSEELCYTNVHAVTIKYYTDCNNDLLAPERRVIIPWSKILWIEEQTNDDEEEGQDDQSNRQVGD